MHAPTPMTSEEIFIEVDGAKGTSSRRWEWIKAWTFKIPSYFWIAFIVLAVLETLAIVGSYYYIKGQTSSNRDASLNVARGECVCDSRC